MIRAIAKRVRRPLTGGLLGAALLGGLATGCDEADRAEAPSGAAGEAQHAPKAPAAGPIERDLRALADALEKAPTVDRLRAEFVTTLPAPSEAQADAVRAVAADPAAGPALRTAARAALGALGDPARTLALREWMNEAIKLPPPAVTRTTEMAVRLMTTLRPALGAALSGLPGPAAAELPPTSPGERTAWTASMAEMPIEPPTLADVPALIRLALSDQAASPRLAWLLLAPIDDPSVTEALTVMPVTDLGEPVPRLDLTWWALALHATTPGGRERLQALVKTEGRAGDRATAVLAWLGDEAARGPAAKLLDRLAGQPDATLDFDRVTFIESAGRMAEGEDAEGPLAVALARYGETNAPVARRARMLAGPAGVAADRDALLDAVAADPTDPRVRRALLPLLRAQDGDRLAALLARDRWSIKGFFHHVRMAQQAPAEALTPAVASALEAVAAEHPDPQTREWALGALAKAPGPLPPVVVEAAAKGSKAGVRTLVMRADDPWQALWSRISGDDDPVRRAAYEMLIAPRLLPLEPTAAQSAQILDQIAKHLTARPEEPWVFLRAARHYVARADGARTPALEKALTRSLRPYCVTTGPDNKPWWDALLTVAQLEHADARALVQDAVKSVPTAGGRAVMRERLGLPADPTDVPPPPEPTAPKQGGHWANPGAPGGGR